MAKHDSVSSEIISERMRELRKRQNLSQARFSEKPELKTSLSENILHAQLKLTFTELSGITNALYYGMDFLIGRGETSSYDFHSEIVELLSDCSDYTVELLFTEMQRFNNEKR